MFTGIARKLILNVLLKRGQTALENALGTAVRHGLTTVGGALMAQGLATSDQVAAIGGAATAIVGIVCSYAGHLVQQKLS